MTILRLHTPSRWALLAAVLASLLLIFSLPAVAQGRQPATAGSGPSRMAHLVPAQAPFYASIRIDRGYRNTLDELLRTLRTAFPELNLLLPGTSVNDLLDAGAQQLLDETFAQQEAWLGDYAALAVQSIDVLFDRDFRNDDFVSVGVFVEIRNSARARTAAERALNRSGTRFTSQRLGSHLIYVPVNESQNFLVVVSDDVLGVTTRGYFDYLRGNDERPWPTLREDARFQRMLSALPAPSYNALIYVDVPQLVLASDRSLSFRAPSERLPRLAAVRGIEPTLIGLTILPDTILTIDVAQPASMPTVLTALGVSVDTSARVNPAFVNLLPNNTVYAIHGTNLAQGYRTVTDALGALVDTATLGLLPVEIGQSGLNSVANLAAAVGLGLDFERDVLDALTGDFLVFVAPNPQLTTQRLPLSAPIDFGVVLQNTDAAIAARVVDRLYRALPVTTRTFSLPVTFYTTDAGFSMLYRDERLLVELVVEQTADYVFVGTVGAHQGVLNAQRQRAVNRFTTNAFPVLPDSLLNGYMSNAGLATTPDLFRLLRVSEGNFTLIRRLAQTFDVGVFSFKVIDGHALLRLTVGVTVPEAVVTPEPPLPTATPRPTETHAPPTATRTPTNTPTPTATATAALPLLPTQPAAVGLSTFVNNNSANPFSITYPTEWSTVGLPPFATDGGVTYIGNTVGAWLPLFGTEVASMEPGDLSMSISVEDIGSSVTLGARTILGVLLGNITGGENAVAQAATIGGRDSAYADLATGRRVVISIIDNRRIMLAFVYAPPGEMDRAFRTASEVLGSVTIVR
jgi:hypothetical protein